MGDFPGDGKFSIPKIFFPPPQGRPEHDGLWLKIKSGSGKDWIGIFDFGYTDLNSLKNYRDHALYVSAIAGW
jgi:hypothetical protein